jgi:sec-independent protein translocase protein TatB
MLDFSLGELMMIGAVALVVLGPERLPRVARGFGEMLGKAQRYVSQVRADFQREIELADLKRLQEEAQKASASIDASVKQVASSLQEAAQQVAGAGAPPLDGAPPAGDAPLADGAPVWSGSGWGSHRFRTRPRPGPSLSDLSEAVERLRGRSATPAAGRFVKNRFAPRSRVNRPRIYR